jgi:sulfite exporter TauE/SafE
MCEGLVKNFSTARTPFFLGLFTGLNPCPPFLVGAARLWTLHSVAKGVALFAAFFVGASFYMAPLIFVSYINKSERVRQVAAMVALLSGVWFLFVGISGLAHV